MGTLSATVRDLLWDKACREVSEGAVVMIHSTNNEQGFAIRSFGDTSRQIEQWEGLFLVRRPNGPNANKSYNPASRAPVPDMELEYYSAIWAKTARGATLKSAEANWHPLICHMIDVAMVAVRLWQYLLPPVLKDKMRRSLGVASTWDTGRWIAYFAGLHDLGKANPGFALKWEEAIPRLMELGLRPVRVRETSPHGFVTTHLLFELLPLMGFERESAFAIGYAVGGHHGRFPSPSELDGIEERIGDEGWRTAQRQLASLLAHLLGVDKLPAPKMNPLGDNPFLILLAGLTSVADWIGSNHQYFPFVGDQVQLPQYWRRARWLALRALVDLGWFHRPAVVEEQPFTQLFDRVPKPNKLQAKLESVASRLDGPSLVILEYPMGGGKTEGALYLANTLQARSGQQGLYVALPTMATSNQMFERVAAYLANRFPGTRINLQLLHSRADLNPHFARLLNRGAHLPDPPIIEDEGDKDGHLLAAEWFTHKKQGLLAPFAIGTVDQALLAALDTKHYFVRLFGLAGKVVVLDEVHAYDVYMQSLLARLLSWLAACGASVILLSATLPARTRNELLAAYAAGRGQVLAPERPEPPYPRVTWFSNGRVEACSVDGAPSRKVRLRTFPSDQAHWITALRQLLEAGGCAAVLCSTVNRAQQIYQVLRNHFPREELLLFHARYPFDDRMEREITVLRNFENHGESRPFRMVCVATQVIEQSLDIDFDLMVSDLAPVDLVLQRTGRIWRHRRPHRPAHIPLPELWLLLPPSSHPGVPLFDPPTTQVYDPHLLLRSYLVLKDRSELLVPDQVEELIESVYREQDPPEGLSPGVASYWRETAKRLFQAQARDQRSARVREIPEVRADLMDRRPLALDEEAEEIHAAHQAMTRLGGPSVEVVCLYERSGQTFLTLNAPEPFDLHCELDREGVKALLGRSLRITFDPGLVRQILDLPVPQEWQATAHLRRHRLLRFAPDGTCLTAELPLKLDPVLGLMKTAGVKGEQM